MSRVEEIERSIQGLSLDEFAEIAQRFHELEQERWDAQLARDSSSGKLDFRKITEMVRDVVQQRGS